MKNITIPMKAPLLPLFLMILMILPIFSGIWAREEGEETYSISLVQTAETEKEVQEVDEKKVQTESYTVKKGEHLWQILRARGILEKRNLAEYLDVLKKMNKSMANLDQLYPGDNIVIPVLIAPAKGGEAIKKREPETIVSLEAIKDLNLEEYTVQPGDTLIKVIKSRQDISDSEIHTRHLQLLKKLNPSIENVDRIYPGQRIKLPIYLPQIVRLPIKPEKALDQETASFEKGLGPVGQSLMDLFTQIGEEWVNTGEHFIPLSSGGQARLKAESFPILNLAGGLRIIVDLHHGLPERIAQMISSRWENYKILQLEKGDNLRTAMDRIIPLCGYEKVYRLGEPLELGTEVHLLLTGDWIIQTSGTASRGERRTVLISFLDKQIPRLSPGMRSFLEGQGVRAIEYPPGDLTENNTEKKRGIIKEGYEGSALIERLLTMVGQSFEKKVEIKAYQSERSEFNLIIKADFLFERNGRECIIDLTGLGEEVISLLRERAFSILSLAGEKEPLDVISKTLNFIDVGFESKSHSFLAVERDASRNIRMTIPGISFMDYQGQKIFVTLVTLPEALMSILWREGYNIWQISLSS